MYREFHTIEALCEQISADKVAVGANAEVARRYPIRFILFDNFKDSFDFVKTLQIQGGVHFESVASWLDNDCNDIIIGPRDLGLKIQNYVESDPRDSIITPFSELARFYNNSDETPEFRTLITTIRAIQSNKPEQRIYIPIVGLEGKMSSYCNDNHTFVWSLKSSTEQVNYRLILSNKSVFGVKGLEDQYTIVANIREWLNVWRDKDAKQDIITTSPSIFAYARFAQPDKAFQFCTCNTAYEFLTEGLKLDFGNIQYRDEDKNHWDRLASELDISNFSFEKFFVRYYDISGLENYNNFLTAWFKYSDPFSRWLLATYYNEKFCNKGYICQVLNKCREYNDINFFSAVSIAIFEHPIGEMEEYREERQVCLFAAARNKIHLSDEHEIKLKQKLEELSLSQGFLTAVRYFSPLTNVEKELAIQWLSDGVITNVAVNEFFPELVAYLRESFGTLDSTQQWALDYIDSYKKAKLANAYTNELEELINERNESQVSFNRWYQNFKTVRTILQNRSDIEVYYWIDGLGVEWIPFIQWLIGNKKDKNVYLNEVYIAKAQLPTTTNVNKQELLGLTEILPKKGDLDEFAHKPNKYPRSIINEIEIVKYAVNDIIAEQASKKIAIVSDHGLTALSQLRKGHNLSGFTSDHYGRVAIRTSGKSVKNNDYVILDDGVTHCALRHESLCGKVPAGLSIHGGCTPEEVLVPIFIVSSQKNASTCTFALIDNEISGANPVVRYRIKGLSSTDSPYLLYNDQHYSFIKEAEDIFVSQKLNLIAGICEIVFCVGEVKHKDYLSLNLGTQEEDLFSF